MLKLNAQLKQQAQREEEEYLQSAEQIKQKILQQKQSKLSAVFDATALNNEHKEQVIRLIVPAALLIPSHNVILQLLKQHQAEIGELEQRLDSERNRQLVALRDKLASRKDRKLKERKRQQEIELQKELLEQKKELEEVRTKQVSCAMYKVLRLALGVTAPWSHLMVVGEGRGGVSY